ncbi:hypothetical protein SNEBB_006971 [Seison nebaliae]|nr:hypothetical protein SNEBB_006971 [Seison nebaliae]
MKIFLINFLFIYSQFITEISCIRKKEIDVDISQVSRLAEDKIGRVEFNWTRKTGENILLFIVAVDKLRRGLFSLKDINPRTANLSDVNQGTELITLLYPPDVLYVTKSTKIDDITIKWTENAMQPYALNDSIELNVPLNIYDNYLDGKRRDLIQRLMLYNESLSNLTGQLIYHMEMVKDLKYNGIFRTTLSSEFRIQANMIGRCDLLFYTQSINPLTMERGQANLIQQFQIEVIRRQNMMDEVTKYMFLFCAAFCYFILFLHFDIDAIRNYWSGQWKIMHVSTCVIVQSVLQPFLCTFVVLLFPIENGYRHGLVLCACFSTSSFAFPLTSLFEGNRHMMKSIIAVNIMGYTGTSIIFIFFMDRLLNVWYDGDSNYILHFDLINLSSFTMCITLLTAISIILQLILPKQFVINLRKASTVLVYLFSFVVMALLMYSARRYIFLVFTNKHLMTTVAIYQIILITTALFAASFNVFIHIVNDRRHLEKKVEKSTTNCLKSSGSYLSNSEMSKERNSRIPLLNQTKNDNDPSLLLSSSSSDVDIFESSRSATFRTIFILSSTTNCEFCLVLGVIVLDSPDTEMAGACTLALLILQYSILLILYVFIKYRRRKIQHRHFNYLDFHVSDAIKKSTNDELSMQNISKVARESIFVKDDLFDPSKNLSHDDELDGLEMRTSSSQPLSTKKDENIPTTTIPMTRASTTAITTNDMKKRRKHKKQSKIPPPPPRIPLRNNRSNEDIQLSVDRCTYQYSVPHIDV